MTEGWAQIPGKRRHHYVVPCPYCSRVYTLCKQEAYDYRLMAREDDAYVMDCLECRRLLAKRQAREGGMRMQRHVCRTCMFWMPKSWVADNDEGNCTRGHGWTTPEHTCPLWEERH